MTEQPTTGVLLEGDDGTHYFIPHTDLSTYAVSDVPEPLTAGADVAPNVPRLHAFSVQRVEPGSETTSVTPMPEGGSEAVAYVPMPEGGPPGTQQS